MRISGEAASKGVSAVVFDLIYTLIFPGEYPGGGDRNAWLAEITGIDTEVVAAEWEDFEPLLESGQAPRSEEYGPELLWARSLASRHGRRLSAAELSWIDRDWDLTRREALIKPPAASLEALCDLRRRGIKIGVLSNTHALEIRTFHLSPLAELADAVVLSHEIKVMKPDPRSYSAALAELSASAEESAYIGDGSSNELAGAKAAGFAKVVFATAAARRLAPDSIADLTAQADIAVDSLRDLPALLARQ